MPTGIGPWTIHGSGTLRIEQSHFPTTCPPCESKAQGGRAYAHIASPDVHIREDRREIVMYIHGRDIEPQVTRVATSTDGLQFKARPNILGQPYFRAFRHRGHIYALAMPGMFYRSQDGLSNFEEGPLLFTANMRHSALLKHGSSLFVFSPSEATRLNAFSFRRSTSLRTGRTGRKPNRSRCFVPNARGKVRTFPWNRRVAAPSTLWSINSATRPSTGRRPCLPALCGGRRARNRHCRTAHRALIFGCLPRLVRRRDRPRATRLPAPRYQRSSRPRGVAKDNFSRGGDSPDRILHRHRSRAVDGAPPIMSEKQQTL